MKQILLTVLLFSLSVCSINAETSKDTATNDSNLSAEIKDVMRSVDEIKRLPVSGIALVKAGDKNFLITDNGHFIVAGNFKLVDMWQGKVINSIADTKDIEKVPLRKIGIRPEELTPFTIGTGKKEVTVFIDPECDYCHQLLGQLEALGNDYRFNLVLIPVLGKNSAEIAKKLICHKDKNVALNALLAKDYSKLPALSKDDTSCDLKPLQKAVVSTKLLDIQGVPFLFLPSGKTFRGLPNTSTLSVKTLLEADLKDEINGK